MKGISTNGEKKSLLQFQKITETERFQKEVARIRKSFKLPHEGLQYTKDTKIKLPERIEFEYQAVGFRWVSKSWYIHETKDILRMFPIMNGYFSILIRNYIYFNKFLYDELKRFREPTSDICCLMSADEEAGYFLLDDDPEGTSWDVQSHNREAGDILYSHPISIRFRADVSQRTLVDFIKKNWGTIEHVQKNYLKKGSPTSFKNSKTSRDKLIAERNNLIYSHRHLTQKQILELLVREYKEFPRLILDLGSIGKIISLEKKKREQK